jgi:hypothetical protein
MHRTLHLYSAQTHGQRDRTVIEGVVTVHRGPRVVPARACGCTSCTRVHDPHPPTSKPTRHLVLLPLAALGPVMLMLACGGGAANRGRIDGTVQRVEGQTLTVATPTGVMRVQLASTTAIATVVASDRAHITDGSFLGIGSVAEPGGGQRAVEVTVFPEALRGTGEGSYAWSRPTTGGAGRMTNGSAGSLTMSNGTASGLRMTNGTVSGRPGDAQLTLTYGAGTKRGAQTISIPPDVPIVALGAGRRADLQPGAHVLVFLNPGSTNGPATADRVLVGKNGLIPPM